jgi:hypothetical protein
VKSIDPQGIYTRAELVEIMGESAFRRLPVRAVGDRYLGKEILDAFLQVHHDVLSNQRASANPKGGELTDETQREIEKMEVHSQEQSDGGSRVAVNERSKGVRGQIARIAG